MFLSSASILQAFLGFGSESGIVSTSGRLRGFFFPFLFFIFLPLEHTNTLQSYLHLQTLASSYLRHGKLAKFLFMLVGVMFYLRIVQYKAKQKKRDAMKRCRKALCRLRADKKGGEIVSVS